MWSCDIIYLKPQSENIQQVKTVYSSNSKGNAYNRLQISTSQTKQKVLVNKLCVPPVITADRLKITWMDTT